MLCDTGPLVALCDDADPHHAACLQEIEARKALELLTTYPCFTEAMHLLGRRRGWRSQALLWRLVADRVLRLDVPPESELIRMRDLMRKYEDTPMDLADASLVAAAERLGRREVFSTDGHFYVYRQKEGQAFEVVP
jgi:hypothetical protein